MWYSTVSGFFLVTYELIVSRFGQKRLLNALNVNVTHSWELSGGLLSTKYLIVSCLQMLRCHGLRYLTVSYLQTWT